jgi:S-DNA-T family DNA segregation ATPase FtsK/SpoIIIE
MEKRVSNNFNANGEKMANNRGAFYSNKRVTGVILLITAILLTILMFIGTVRTGLVGFFGWALCSYIPILTITGMLNVLGKSPVVKQKNIVLFIILFFLFVATLHVMLAKNLIEGTESYVIQPLFGYETVGGMLISLVTAPLLLIVAKSYVLLLAILFLTTATVALWIILPFIQDLRRNSSPKPRSQSKRAKSKKTDFYTSQLNFHTDEIQADGYEMTGGKTPFIKYYEKRQDVSIAPEMHYKHGRSVDDVFGESSNGVHAKKFGIINDLKTVTQKVEEKTEPDFYTNQGRQALIERNLAKLFTASPTIGDTATENNTALNANNNEKIDFKNKESYINNDLNTTTNPIKFVNEKIDTYASLNSKPIEKTDKSPFSSSTQTINNRMDVTTRTISVNESSIVLAPPLVSKRKYIKPPLSLFRTYPTDAQTIPVDYASMSQRLEDELSIAGIPATVITATKGPVFTRYELRLTNAQHVSKIKSDLIINSLKMRLAVQVLVVEAPIKGKDAVGLLFTNARSDIVGLKSILSSTKFESDNGGITFALGKDIDGEACIANLKQTSHLIVAGATGTGKSVFMNSMLLSILYKHSPEDVRFLIIDPKRVEFRSYAMLPHMLTRSAIIEIDQSLSAIKWLINEMEKRYKAIEEAGYRAIDEYNARPRKENEPKLPRIILFVDELAEIVLTSKGEADVYFSRLAQVGRAAGIHVVLATQRPMAKIVSGLISANIVHRVAFQVNKNLDSRIILDDAGAENLIGRGDMLYKSNVDIVHMQGAFVSDEEINAVCEFIKRNNEAVFDDELEKAIRFWSGADSSDTVTVNTPASVPADESNIQATSTESDPIFKRLLHNFIMSGKASTNSAMTSFSISYIRAKKMIDIMSKKGYLDRENGNKPRDVLITYDEFVNIYGAVEDAQ